MIARRLDEVLAQTDPFDLAQAVERRVRTLSQVQIRGLIRDALPRMSEYYVEEFARVQTIDDEPSLRSAFAHALKSNLRAIPLFRPSFGESLLALTRTDGALGFEETARPSRRWVAATVVGVALLAAAAAGGRYVTNARSLASTTAAMTTVQPVATIAPATRSASPGRRPGRSAAARKSVPRAAQNAFAPQRAVAGTQAASASAASPPMASMNLSAGSQQPARIYAAPVPAHREAQQHLPTARGASIVVAVPHKPRNVDAVQTNGIDTTDMPEPYTDATPLPQETAAPLNAPHAVRLSTPTPAPRRHGWLYRSIIHLDPFKPHPQGTP